MTIPQRFVDCLSYFLDKTQLCSKTNALHFENLYVGTTSWFLDVIQKLGGIVIVLFFLNKRFTNNKVKKKIKKYFYLEKHLNGVNLSMKMLYIIT